MHVFRMCREPHTTLDGEGARLAGGRWNPKGTPVIYASQSEALAYLEVLVGIRKQRVIPGDLVCLVIDIPDSLHTLSNMPVESLRLFADAIKKNQTHGSRTSR